MEYKGYNLSEAESVLLYDILQEIKGVREDLAKPHEVIEEIQHEPEKREEIQVPVEVPIEAKPEVKRKPAAKKRTAKGRKPKTKT